VRINSHRYCALQTIGSLQTIYVRHADRVFEYKQIDPVHVVQLQRGPDQNLSHRFSVIEYLIGQEVIMILEKNKPRITPKSAKLDLNSFEPLGAAAEAAQSWLYGIEYDRTCFELARAKSKPSGTLHFEDGLQELIIKIGATRNYELCFNVESARLPSLIWLHHHTLPISFANLRIPLQ